MRWLALVLLLVNVAFAAWLADGAPGRPHESSGPPPEIGHLALLREGDNASGQQQQQAGACYTLGPFEDVDRAHRARARLSDLGLDPSQRSTTDDEVYGYQVILPPFPSRDAALDATHRLARKGIKDYFIVVSDPKLENAVSVGLFHEKRYAVRQTRYLEKLGFKPQMRARTRTRTRYWEDYRDPGGKVTGELLESLAADGQLQRLRRPCG